MPADSFGKHRPNTQIAAHMSKGTGKSPAPGEPNAKEKLGMGEETGDHSELHDHGDGTYHSVIGGEKTEHPSIGHALMHMAAHHEPEGVHHHATHDGMSITSHHVMHGGEVEGPHQHETPEEAGEHMASVMGGEGGDEPHGESDGEGMGRAGMEAMMSGM